LAVLTTSPSMDKPSRLRSFVSIEIQKFVGPGLWGSFSDTRGGLEGSMHYLDVRP
jgi:hypothetical protein